MRAVCQELDKLNSVFSVVNHPNGTFYHSLFFVENESKLKIEFKESTLVDDFFWTKAAFFPLPEQLRRVGKGSMIKTYDNIQLENLLDKFYILNSK